MLSIYYIIELHDDFYLINNYIQCSSFLNLAPTSVHFKKKIFIIKISYLVFLYYYGRVQTCRLHRHNVEFQK